VNPTFDTSLALEFLAFTGPDAIEAIASVLENARPSSAPSPG
jgi:enoyl-CoA hydratase